MKDSFLTPLKEQILLLYTRKTIEKPLDKEKYRPVGILPLLSKVYERAIYTYKIFQIKFFAGLVKLIVLNMLCLDYFKRDKKNLITLVM